MGNSPSAASRRETHKAIAKCSSRMSIGCISDKTLLDNDPSSTPASAKEGSITDKRPSTQSDSSLAPSALAYSPIPQELSHTEANAAYKTFIKHFPEYQLTWLLDTLRRTDYSRLDRCGECYVDYMGGAIYPESLVRVHAEFLSQNIMGNTHSVSNSSQLSSTCADEARATVLGFFRAPPGYTVIFTPNTTGALKLVGESFPFEEGSSFVLSADSHNSVHGIRRFATTAGASVHYIESTERGGFELTKAKDILKRNKPRSASGPLSLFALTGQSNISNTKDPLSVAQYASSLGYYTLLDAAALAATSVISLSATPVDAMAVSFYKMFGFPTGVGALVVKKSFLQKLRRPWFAGGTINVVQVPGNIVTMAGELHEQFEDGTVNYLTLPAITNGIRFFSAYQPILPLRLSSLTHFLTSSLCRLRHDKTGQPVVRILSRIPTRRLQSVGEQSDTGSTVSLIFLSPTGDMIPNTFIEFAASTQCISLRTGCMCNPGGAAAMLGIKEDMDRLYPGVTLKDFERTVGRELGVVRISLGLVSSFQDVWRVIQFAAIIGNEKERNTLWNRWMAVCHVDIAEDSYSSPGAAVREV